MVPGKTYTALEWAHTLADRVAAIDTEHGSMSTYAGHRGWDFDVITPDSFDPGVLATTIQEAGAEGYGALVIDSLSHYWAGPGGMLELSSRLQKGADKFSGWTAAGEREKKMLDALLSFPGHLICTLRTKNEKVIQENDKGKKQVVDVVLKPVQREGIEYEFGFFGELDLSNTLTVTKSRILTLPAGEQIAKPDGRVAIQIRDYLAEGEKLPTPNDYAESAAAADTREELRALLDDVHRVGYDGAGVKGPTGKIVPLRDLIIELGLKVAA